jgi:hypothetical protein
VHATPKLDGQLGLEGVIHFTVGCAHAL